MINIPDLEPKQLASWLQVAADQRKRAATKFEEWSAAHTELTTEEQQIRSIITDLIKQQAAAPKKK